MVKKSGLTCRKGNSILWRNAVPTKRGSRKWQGQLWSDMSKRQLHTVEERRADKKMFKEKATAALGSSGGGGGGAAGW
eukprot:g17867.t1